jgi:protein phosphatase
MPLSAVFPACRFEVACATHPGRSRNRNEDSFLVEQVSWANLDQRKDYALICIADGMGGYDAGDQASNLVIRTVGSSLAGVLQAAVSRQPPGSGTTREALAGAIESALQEANRVVHQKAQSDSSCQGMGATAVVLVLWENQAVIGHVGDCRVYHFRAGQLRQVTKDQTLLARMLELGQISPKEALHHPARNEVAQAVGRRSFLETGRYELNLMRGDWLIAACDGLHTHVEGQQLQDVLKGAANQSAAHLANHLVDLANQQGGSDNITVAAVRCY